MIAKYLFYGIFVVIAIFLITFVAGEETSNEIKGPSNDEPIYAQVRKRGSKKSRKSQGEPVYASLRFKNPSKPRRPAPEEETIYATLKNRDDEPIYENVPRRKEEPIYASVRRSPKYEEDEENDYENINPRRGFKSRVRNRAFKKKGPPADEDEDDIYEDIEKYRRPRQ